MRLVDPIFYLHLTGEGRVSEALADDLRDSQIEASTVANVQTVVIAEYLFSKVAVKMKRLDTNVGSPDGALQEAPKVFETVSVDSPSHIGDGMVNDFVSVLRSESFIRAERVSVDRRAFLNVSFDVRDKGFPLSAGNHRSTDCPAALQESENGGFVFIASSSNFCAVFREVHVPRFATYKGFVNFDFPTQLSEGFILQGKTNPVHHKPCSFLSDAEITRYFIRTDSIFAVGQHPNCGKPLFEADSGVLKDSSHLDGKLALGVMTSALPDATARVELDLGRAASRADNAIRPAPRHKVFEAVVGIREVHDCFLKAFRFQFHHVPHKQQCTENRWMCQVYSCPR